MDYCLCYGPLTDNADGTYGTYGTDEGTKGSAKGRKAARAQTLKFQPVRLFSLAQPIFQLTIS